MFHRENNCETRSALLCLGIVAVFSAASADSLRDSVDLSQYSIDKDIPYGEDPQQVFDLYISAQSDGRERPAITIVFSHGGGYYLSDKSEEEQYIQPFLDNGFDVVNINYRLGQGVFAANSDLASLLRHLVEERGTYRFASDRLVLMGFSAGGQMSANIGFWQNEMDDPFNTPKEADIAAIVNISGPSHNFAEVEQIFLNFDYQPFRELGAALFPPNPSYTKDQLISMVEPFNQFDEEDPPIFLWYGERDAQVPPSTHRKLLATIGSDSSKHRVIYEPDGQHSPSEVEFTRAIAELMNFLGNL
jgi:acetyl esterase/lipase